MRLLRLLFAPLLFLLRLLRQPFRLRARRKIIARHGWVELHVEGEILEQRPRLSRARALYQRFLKAEEPKRVVLSRLRLFVDELIADPNAKGLLLKIGPLGGGWASADAVRAQLERIKHKSIPIVAHVNSYAGNREMVVASTASKLYFTPSGGLASVGTAAIGLFLKDTLERVGVRVEVASRGRYKSAPDQLTRNARSDFDREQSKALVDAFDDKLLSSVSSLYGFDRTAAEAMVDRAPLVGTSALAAGYCHGLARDEDLIEILEGVAGLPAIDPAAKKRRERLALVGAGNYLAVRALRPLWRAKRKSLGIVEVHGAIVDQAPRLGPGGGRAAIEAAVVADLRAATANPSIGAVVLHVNSRGGSVTASDGIYSAVRRLNQEKPVIACFGDVAASGGYYVACGARAIVSAPLTITGSIGVFAMLPTWPELAKRLGVVHDVLRNRKNAALYDPWSGFSDADRAHADQEVGAMYETFLALVAETRQKTRDQIHTVAEGRVWTGAAAKDAGLLDGLGGMEEAMERAKAAAKARFHDDVVLISSPQSLPRPEPFVPEPPAKSWAPWLELGADLLGADATSRELLAELVQLASAAHSTWPRALFWSPIGIE